MCPRRPLNQSSVTMEQLQRSSTKTRPRRIKQNSSLDGFFTEQKSTQTTTTTDENTESTTEQASTTSEDNDSTIISPLSRKMTLLKLRRMKRRLFLDLVAAQENPVCCSKMQTPQSQQQGLDLSSSVYTVDHSLAA